MKIAIYTLGCKVNTYESNVLESIFLEKGYLVDEENPDICVVNTCTVTNAADRKSRQLINKLKRENPKAIIAVIGCMAQINGNNLSNIDKIDILLGNNNKTKLFEYINKFIETKEQQIDINGLKDNKLENMCAVVFNQTRAYVKIQDGCDSYCSYCIIPYARGTIKSKKTKDIIKEIKGLVDIGFKEVVLTGIHTGKYGKDINTSFDNLLEEIIKIKELKRLRISSIEINEITERTIDLIKNNKVFARHLHIPLQSGSNQVLIDMNRKYNIEEFKNKINIIKKELPDISITTDLIVGFPSETEELFKETVKNIKEIEFSNIHVFPFSLRKGTQAENIKNLVTDKEKKDRTEQILKISEELEIKYMKSMIGKTVEAIFEKPLEDHIGHTSEYLKVKTEKDIELNKITTMEVSRVDYPYCIVE